MQPTPEGHSSPSAEVPQPVHWTPALIARWTHFFPVFIDELLDAETIAMEVGWPEFAAQVRQFRLEVEVTWRLPDYLEKLRRAER
jgi:hypothetical protein